jgi:hypothetical protein
VFDVQSLGPVELRPGRTTTIGEPVVLHEVSAIRVTASTGAGRVELGRTLRLAAAVLDAAGQPVAGRTVQWSSEQPTVATVDAVSGVVTAVSLGSARIRATAGGRTGTFDVVVVRPVVPVTISASGTSGGGTVRSEPAGIDCTIDAGTARGSCTFEFPADAPVTLTAAPIQGSVFVAWSGSCATAGATSACRISANAPSTIGVAFAALRRLAVSGVGSTGAGTVTSAPTGIDCRVAADAGAGDCGADFRDGAVVSLAAQPASGSVLDGWSGACTGSAPTCRITMDRAASVGVVFRLAPVPVTIVAGGSGAGVILLDGQPACAHPGGAPTSCTVAANAGATVVIAASPAMPSHQVVWGGACSATTGPACTLKVDAATTVGVQFVPQASLVVRVFNLTQFSTSSVQVDAGGRSLGNCGPAPNVRSETCTFSAPVGALVVLTAEPGETAILEGWDAPCQAPASDSCLFVLTGDLSVGATFIDSDVGSSRVAPIRPRGSGAPARRQLVPGRRSSEASSVRARPKSG